MKKIICALLALAMLFSLCACGEESVKTTSKKDGEKTADNAETDGGSDASSDAEPVNVAITVKDFGTMTFELYPDIAPVTVENFLAYVNKGFYDGLTFHRVYKGFMIQGGDPKGNGTGNGDLPAIKGEFSSNGVNNTLSHKKGVISMARSQVADSATCQFFICNADSTFLDGDYAAFGKLTDGEDVLDAISDIEVTMNDFGEKSKPVNPPVIESITVID